MDIKLFLLLSVITASISFLLIQSKLFQFFRNWVGECPLFKCGFCFGHWVALALVIGFKFRLFNIPWFVDIIFTTLTVAWTGGFQYICMSIIVDLMEALDEGE